VRIAFISAIFPPELERGGWIRSALIFELLERAHALAKHQFGALGRHQYH
jgi:hypothetical protein